MHYIESADMGMGPKAQTVSMQSCLMQVCKYNWHFICYGSSTMTSSQKIYSTYNRSCRYKYY